MKPFISGDCHVLGSAEVEPVMVWANSDDSAVRIVFFATDGNGKGGHIALHHYSDVQHLIQQLETAVAQARFEETCELP